MATRGTYRRVASCDRSVSTREPIHGEFGQWIDVGPPPATFPAEWEPASMLLRHTLLYLPAQVAGPLAQFVAAVVWTHWMSPDGYGVLTFVLAGQDLVFLICLSWWSQYTLRYFGGLSGEASVPYRDSEAALLAATAVLQVIATLLLLVFVRDSMSPLLALGAIA